MWERTWWAVALPDWPGGCCFWRIHGEAVQDSGCGSGPGQQGDQKQNADLCLPGDSRVMCVMVHLPTWLALSIHIFLIPAGCSRVNNALDREAEGKTVILGEGDILLSVSVA